MGCRCSERRAAIVDALSGVASGDAEAVAKAASFVVRSAAEDARAAASAVRVKAAARLGIGRR
jgi:hypothetical protein